MPTLLYLDDSPEILDLKAASLRISGFDVTTCNSPWKGLARLATRKFHAVVTDYDMPGLDGFVFADHARANGYSQPILLCTGSFDLPQAGGQSIDKIIKKADHPLALANALKVCLERECGGRRPMIAMLNDDLRSKDPYFAYAS